ncbi:hypothetical protein B4071_4297 [Bacillus subtilis]|nr:hypothetical protein B4071_4297 [Bacillus subtilis]
MVFKRLLQQPLSRLDACVFQSKENSVFFPFVKKLTLKVLYTSNVPYFIGF